MTETKKLTGNQLRKGMIIDGRTIESARNGAGSAKIWTYVQFAEPSASGSHDGRFRRNGIKIEVEIPV